MITRIERKRLVEGFTAQRQPRLTALEKGMLRWVTVDPEDRVLDANIGSGMMAEYLRRNMLCEVCGVSDNMEHVRQARSALRSCDIVYAAQGDIPWRAEAFDTVLMKLTGEGEDVLRRMLTEARRVLRPGGQLILGAPCFPAQTTDAATGERRYFCRKQAESLLVEAAFDKVTWERTGLASGVLIAWKDASPEVKAIRSET